MMGKRRQFNVAGLRVVILGALLLAMLGVASWRTSANAPPELPDRQAGDYVVLSWNDLGMHCYNPDFQDLAVLPPYNNLWAQVIRVGDPPEIVTSGIDVTYLFEDNTYSVGKTNFWDYEEAVFGVDLPPNVGLTGKGLAGTMDPDGPVYVAEGIPLTEFSDSNPQLPDPYQLATVIVTDATSGEELARTHPVAPVSTEMHCDNCHYDGGVEGIATGKVDTNILTLHDMASQDEYPPGHEGPLMGRRPILCAECHASNALGLPGAGDVPSLSRAIHEKHKEIVPDTLDGCYNCHPGPQTECLRDVMSTQYGMDCADCHGGMQQVAENPDPWLNEPRCDDCHTDPGFEQNDPLYRLSTGHGGIYCEACHDSTHAVAPSAQPADSIKFLELQGHMGPLDTCTVCHATQPNGPGPHDLPPGQPAQLLAYVIARGTYVSGNLQSLLSSDDVALRVQSASVAGGALQWSETVIVGASPSPTASRLDLTLEARANGNGVLVKLLLYNFALNRWDEQGQWVASTTDQVFSVANVAGPQQYVRPGDGQVRARLSTWARGVAYPSGYTVSFDQLQTLVRP